ncbi:ornithine racemase Orr [Aminipila luticellarii]|uniref:Alanine/ornithine racemase family PLP-dependent enzyme n=1 Tax=Aminipila luticellarii TaxID=2507160 RepID=A0A410PYG8_9FIRM|nr:ornithine racemase Orr [Aminipila luticellarii]QAT43988.1 alanine/ornithine racemase family PLP-dependent enzyme [Aminipila luticellarii]
MYPKLIIDLKKLNSNLDAVAKITKEDGNCSLMIVTKGLCADPQMVKLVAEHKSVDFMADSRVKNIATYADLARKNGKKTVLLRLPMHSEIEEVVKYVDLSFNSEISTIRLLNEEAARQKKLHKVLLMIDLGDLREGLFYKEEALIFNTIEEILKMSNVEFYGIGVNLTCYGAIIPKNDNLSILAGLAEKIEKTYSTHLHMVSGGNSSSIYLIGKGELPKGINNLRLGEAFLLGNDTAYGAKLPGTTGDTLTLEAQIVELQKKPSLPIGEVGVDAFGQKPYYEDRGIIKRAIIGIGKQDTDLDSMTPIDEKIDILGGSSDHTILDVTKSDTEYKVGDIVSFELGYGGMLKTATSPYVEKEYRK